MDFDFVITSGNPSVVSQSNHRMVRRRATQVAAMTRRRRHNKNDRSTRFQPLPWLVSDPLQPGAGSVEEDTQIQSRQLIPAPTTALSSSSETSRLFARRELLEFSKTDICGVLLSHKSHLYVFGNPVQTQKILMLTKAQLFTGLGEMNVHSQCLDDAVECLWTYLLQCLLPENIAVDQKKSVKCYVRALNSLHSALNDGDDLYNVWHAALIMIVYEVRR
jgi:hypothetical protein